MHDAFSVRIRKRILVYTTIWAKERSKSFGKKGKLAALKEVKQVHDRKVFEPVSVEELSKLKKERAMESLAFLTEKRDKARISMY